jgi:hypothetical protein
MHPIIIRFPEQSDYENTNKADNKNKIQAQQVRFCYRKAMPRKELKYLAL